MLQLHNIREAIKQAKKRKNYIEGAQKVNINISRQRLSRITKGESKATIKELEAICAVFGLQLVLLNEREYAFLAQNMRFLGENGAK